MFSILCLLFIFLNNIKAEKFCVNCKYFKRSFLTPNTFGRCSVFPKKNFLEKEKEIDYLVSGKKEKIEYRFCTSVRMEENSCGPKGRYYEKREDPFISFICTSKKNEKKEDE